MKCSNRLCIEIINFSPSILKKGSGYCIKCNSDYHKKYFKSLYPNLISKLKNKKQNKNIVFGNDIEKSNDKGHTYKYTDDFE